MFPDINSCNFCTKITGNIIKKVTQTDLQNVIPNSTTRHGAEFSWDCDNQKLANVKDLCFDYARLPRVRAEHLKKSYVKDRKMDEATIPTVFHID